MPAVTKTRADLVERAAQKGMLIAAGQSLEAEDQVVIDGAVDGMLAEYEARNIVSVADEDNIDLAIFEQLAEILGQRVAPDFGKQTDLTRIAAAEQVLYAVGMSQPTYEVLEAEHF